LNHPNALDGLSTSGRSVAAPRRSGRGSPRSSKDQLLQENGYLVLRYLAEDLARELDSVLDGILRSVSTRRKPGTMAIPITIVRGSRA